MLYEHDIVFMLAKTLIATVFTIGMILSTTQLKVTFKKAAVYLAVYLFWVAATSFLLIDRLGWQPFLKIFFFTISAPAILLIHHMAKEHAMQAVFNYMTQINLSLLLLVTVTLLGVVIPIGQAGDLFLRAALYSLVIFLEYRFVRKPFLRIADTLEDNWLVLALVPVSFCALFFLCALYPQHFLQDSWATVRIYALSVTMATVYFVIFQSLLKNCAAFETQKDNVLLTAETESLQKQLDMLSQSEAKVRQFREQILRFAEETGPAYCKNEMVNIALSFTFRKAEDLGFSISHGLDMPQNFRKIHSAELAVALVNAINDMTLVAPEETDPKHRFLCLYTCYVNHQLAIELEAPCKPDIYLEPEGPKYADGRNVISQSVSAFAKKYGDPPFCELAKGRLTIRMLADD